MSMLKVIMCPAERPPYVTNISGSLENMQKIVGGYIETVTIDTSSGPIVIVCNEDGRIQDLPENRSLFLDGFCGDCFICGVSGEEFADIPEGIRIKMLRLCKKHWDAIKESQQVIPDFYGEREDFDA